MQELRLVAVSEDGTYLVLASAGRGTRFTLPVDDRLRAAVRGQFSRLGQYEIEVENPLRPKEIQARIRSGETAEAIAELAGIPIERVRWFESPVLQEREFMAQQAQRASVRGPGDTAPGPALGDLVSERVGPHQLETGEAVWDAWKREDGSWHVKLAFLLNGQERLAHWVFEPRRRTVVPVDDEAARFSDPSAGGVSGDGGATVTPFVPRRNGGAEPAARPDGPLARPGAEEPAPQRSAQAPADPPQHPAPPPAEAPPAADREEAAPAAPDGRPAARAHTAPAEPALTETERAFTRTGRERAVPGADRPADSGFPDDRSPRPGRERPYQEPEQAFPESGADFPAADAGAPGTDRAVPQEGPAAGHTDDRPAERPAERTAERLVERPAERASRGGPEDDVFPSAPARRSASAPDRRSASAQDHRSEPAAEAPPRERTARPRPSMGPAVPDPATRRPAERPQEPRGRTPVTARATDQDDQKGHAPGTGDSVSAAAAAGGGAAQPARKKGRGRRASVPSWDEIMFGSKKPE
ncbi:septation protein SepH [Nocardiopsis sp. RSe5-2]|uniref:Septation protein SepH n=1 Tax=Nocardiopsis endophytica TaxID=3018445 RepID=A0ABT4U929_9ACTN|nr:septation protein SepH [Nocardiopsis endophytica]MDA2813459.1 septation protein SepH [Nocardiopsis endophytica]